MIIVVITARPSYARVKTVLEGLKARNLDTVVLVAASGLIHRYGRVVDMVVSDGWQVMEVPALVDGNSLLTGALTTAHLTDALSREFARFKPQLVVTIADRKETLATSIAASYQHIPLMHLLSDERSGSIDDKVRAANRALADYHHETYVMGCPSVDLALRAQQLPATSYADLLGGVGSDICLTKPFILLLQHPVSSETALADEQMAVTIGALCQIPLPVLALWPGEEAGAEAAAKRLRRLHEQHTHQAWHFIVNMDPEVFYRVLTQAACIVGNSSVGIREASALGVRCVNIGSRQRGRTLASNVWLVPRFVTSDIRLQLVDCLDTTPDVSLKSSLYGDGQAGERIAAWIQQIVVSF